MGPKALRSPTAMGMRAAQIHKAGAQELRSSSRRRDCRALADLAVAVGIGRRTGSQVSDCNASGLEGAVIKHVLDHVVNNPTVGRVESAGCTAGLFTFCNGIDCIQTKKLTDTAHGNK